MELLKYLKILWRRKNIIAVTAIVTVGVVAIGTLMKPPVYRSSAILRILTATSGSTSWVEYNITYTDRLMNTYATIVTSSPMIEEVRQRLHLDASPHIEVETLPNTELLQITAEDTNPTTARDIANTAAEILIDQSKTLAGGTTKRAYALSIIEPALAPRNPSEPDWMVNIGLGFIVGLAGGIGLSFIIENLDTTLYATQQIGEVSVLPILGEIPRSKKTPSAPLFESNSPQEEAFCRLRTNLFAGKHARTSKTLLIASPEPKEGKSTVVANLAFAIARADQKVIVVDGDLRKPVQHKLFNLPNESGLSDLLMQGTTLEEALHETAIPDLYVLTSGSPVPNPVELLGSPEMNRLLEHLKQQFDWTLLDTPAFVAVADAATLASMVNGVLLVVEQAQTREEVLKATQQQLDIIKVNPLGIVVNKALQINDHYHYYHAYDPQSSNRHNSEKQRSSRESLRDFFPHVSKGKL